MPKDIVKQQRCRQTHGRTHESNGASLTHKAAKIGVVARQVAVFGGKTRTGFVAPKAGDNDNEQAHEGCFFKRIHQNSAAHSGNTAHIKRIVVHFHTKGHGVGHDDPEDDSLHFCFWHKATSLSQNKKNEQRGRATGITRTRYSLYL